MPASFNKRDAVPHALPVTARNTFPVCCAVRIASALCCDILCCSLSNVPSRSLANSFIFIPLLFLLDFYQMNVKYVKIFFYKRHRNSNFHQFISSLYSACCFFIIVRIRIQPKHPETPMRVQGIEKFLIDYHFTLFFPHA